MKLREKLEAWMDRWVGTARITGLPEGMPTPSANAIAMSENPISHERSPSSARIEMQDVFFLQSKNERQTPKDTVALYFSDLEAIAVRHPETGEVQRIIPFQNAQGLTPLWGRFGENGEESVALYDPSTGYFRIWDTLDHAEPTYQFLFGPPGLGWIPLTGDWDGDGQDGLGLYCPESSTFLLKNTLEGGDPDQIFMFGVPAQGWIPVTGDWDGDGQSGIGLYIPHEGVFYLKNALQGGEHETEVRISTEAKNLIPIAGDWSGRGQDEVALFDPTEGVFHLGSSEALETEWPHFAFGSSNSAVTPMRMKWCPQKERNQIGGAT